MTIHSRNIHDPRGAFCAPLVSGGARPSPRGVYPAGGKRLLDLGLTILAMPVWVPVLVLAALAVICGGHSPFYGQMRVGRGGRMFRIWKLRTMVPGADDLLDGYLARDPAARAEWIRDQKLKNDPRVTRVGRLLRKTSLDELPQLWNVLIGEMSLVGPRPMTPDQRSLYPGTRYYAVRPGLTGFWQISDRNACGFRDRAGFDDAYWVAQSLRVDLTVIWHTVSVVLRGTGY